MKKNLFLLFALVASTTLSQAAIVEGTCGDNLTWSLNTEDSTLTIEGSGDMDWEYYSAPWLEYKSYIVHVNLPERLTSIREFAFANCTNLTSVTIPDNVTIIGEMAFEHCESLKSMEIPSSVTSIERDAFGRCSGLTTLMIGNSVISIGADAFHRCTGLTSIEIPNSVTSIGNSAFSACGSLTSATIGNNVINIGNGAFEYCAGLTTITCKAANPPAMGSNVFIFVDTSIPLYVPAESITAYQAANQWKDFYNILALEEANEMVYDTKHPSKLIRNGSVYILTDDTRTYTLTGQQVR